MSARYDSTLIARSGDANNANNLVTRRPLEFMNCPSHPAITQRLDCSSTAWRALPLNRRWRRPMLITTPAESTTTRRTCPQIIAATFKLVRDRATREPLVPYNASGEANAPMAAFAAAAKAGGLWPFVNMNRTHVVPPCTITEAEAKAGLAALDHALDAADAHTV